jgi:general secretion pathway protein K
MKLLIFRGRQSGAALLAAMLTVTLVATFAAAAMWQQWRGIEVEAAERSRIQASWVLVGALDWARLILREDGRTSGSVDNLTEVWAVPLEEARLSSFLSAEKNIASDSLEGLPDALLSGRIVDAQAKLNVINLVDGGKPAPASVAAFTKLFALLGLPDQEVGVLTASLTRALGTSTDPDSGSDASIPLMPQHTSQLVWFGLSRSTAAALEPYVTVLPIRTPINLNTASAEVIYASAPLMDLASARRLVERRASAPFPNPAAASALLAADKGQFVEGEQSVSTQFFEVLGRLRLDHTWVEEHSLLQRDGLAVKTLWRERGSGAIISTSNANSVTN